MRRVLTLGSLTLAVLLAVGGCSGKSSSKNSDGDPAHPKDGEVFLERFDQVGKNAFTDSVAFAAIPALKRTTPGHSVRGSDDGLYAGSKSKGICDAAALVSALEHDTDAAQAWADALNRDPTLQWSGGAKLAPEDIEAFVVELTPVVVRADTRVTNYAKVSGRGVARQSVLQHGTAILVDAQGMPRTRCASGSPLTRPSDVSGPKFRGVEWAGFEAADLVVVTPAVEVLDALRVIDLHTHNLVSIPTGSTCCDEAAPTTTTSTTSFTEDTTTTRPKSTTTSSVKPATTTSHATTTTGVSGTTAPTTTTPQTTTSCPMAPCG